MHISEDISELSVYNIRYNTGGTSVDWYYCVMLFSFCWLFQCKLINNNNKNEAQNDANADSRWMIYTGPGFFAVAWFGSSPTPTPSPVSKHERDTQKTEKERQLADGRGGRGWGWSQIIRRRESLVLDKSFKTLQIKDKFFLIWTQYCCVCLLKK